MDIGNGKFKVYPRLWAVGNFARFIRPGWVRVDATASPSTGVLVSAYRDKSAANFAVVVINKNDSEQPFSLVLEGAKGSSVIPYRTSATEKLDKLPEIKLEDGKLNVKLPPASVTTFVGNSK